MSLIITLILIGLLLLAIELLIIPGFGIAGILGMIAIIGAVIMAFVQMGTVAGLIVLGCVIVATAIFTWLILRSDTWKNISLKESITSKTGKTPQENNLNKGDTGVALSRLAPSGKARFGKTDVEVWSQSGMIYSGTLIEIYAIEGRKIFVTIKN
jgi:membrane-bound ClpP family serine protease